MVRSHLDYCCPVLSPYGKGAIEALEKVQKRATRMIPAVRIGWYLRTISGEVTVVHVTWPRLAVTWVVSARPARCSDRVGVLWSTRSWLVYGAKVSGGRRTIYKTCAKDGPGEVADEINRTHQIERECVTVLGSGRVGVMRDVVMLW